MRGSCSHIGKYRNGHEEQLNPCGLYSHLPLPRRKHVLQSGNFTPSTIKTRIVHKTLILPQICPVYVKNIDDFRNSAQSRVPLQGKDLGKHSAAILWVLEGESRDMTMVLTAFRLGNEQCDEGLQGGGMWFICCWTLDPGNMNISVRPFDTFKHPSSIHCFLNEKRNTYQLLHGEPFAHVFKQGILSETHRSSHNMF